MNVVSFHPQNFDKMKDSEKLHVKKLEQKQILMAENHKGNGRYTK